MALAYLCFLAVLASFLHEGFGLLCYECNSKDNPACEQKPLPTSIEAKECNNTAPICRIIWSEVTKIDHPHKARLVRMCGQKTENDKKNCYRIADGGSDQRVCSCSTDLCNSTTRPVAATILLLLAVAATWLEHLRLIEI